jgi:hypothetical protein
MIPEITAITEMIGKKKAKRSALQTLDQQLEAYPNLE